MGLGEEIIENIINQNRSKEKFLFEQGTKKKMDNESRIMELMGVLDSVNMMKRELGNVPSYSGWKAIPGGLWQEGKQLLRENPDLTGYEGLRDSLLSQYARRVGEDKGNLAEGDVKRAMSAFPTSFSSLEERNKQWSLIDELLQTAMKRYKGDMPLY